MTDTPPAAATSEAEAIAAAQEVIQQLIRNQANRPEAVDPDKDAGEPDDGVQMVKNGMVRLFIGDDVWRLRAPDVGDLKVLRLAQEGYEDELDEANLEMKRVAHKSRAAAVEANAMPEGIERDEAIAAANKAAKIQSRKVMAMADDLRIKWYRLVFQTLNVDRVPNARGPKTTGRVPDEFPGWATNADLATRLVEHWRTVPLGRGYRPAQ